MTEVFEEEPEKRPPSVRTKVSSQIKAEEDDESPVDLQALARPAPVSYALELEPDEEGLSRAKVPPTSRAPSPPAPSGSPILAELLARAAEETAPAPSPATVQPEQGGPGSRFLRTLEAARLPAPNLAWGAVFAGLVWVFGKGWEGAGLMGTFCLVLTLLGVKWKFLVGAASLALLAAAGTELVSNWGRFEVFFSTFF